MPNTDIIIPKIIAIKKLKNKAMHTVRFSFKEITSI